MFMLQKIKANKTQLDLRELGTTPRFLVSVATLRSPEKHGYSDVEGVAKVNGDWPIASSIRNIITIHVAVQTSCETF